MKNECTHNYEVKHDVLMTVRFVCKKCGTVKYLRRKYACFLYLLGLTGWIPSFFFGSLEISSLLKLLLFVTTYLTVNFVICFLFYKWLTTRETTQLNPFISD